jgi:hypothetical protein
MQSVQSYKRRGVSERSRIEKKAVKKGSSKGQSVPSDMEARSPE